MAEGLRIGLLGGSFNPAHAGHIHISEVAFKRLGLDYVWWLVSPQNPLKPVTGMASLEQRLEGARFLAARHPHILVTDIERNLGTQFTIDTLTELRRRFPQPCFVWLMGSDALATFHLWRRWPEIVLQAPIAVVTRPETVLAALCSKAMQRYGTARKTDPRGFASAPPPAIAILEGPRNRLSSTAIRLSGAR